MYVRGKMLSYIGSSRKTSLRRWHLTRDKKVREGAMQVFIYLAIFPK